MNENIQTAGGYDTAHTAQGGWEPGGIQKRIAAICVALPCIVFIATWVIFSMSPGLFWDSWMLDEGIVRWNVISAFGWSLVTLLLTGWFFIAGVRLFLNPVSIFSVIFTVLAALPFLFFVLIGLAVIFHS